MPGSQASRRILFVEDEESISEPFSEALRRAGFEPVVARTAAEALEFAERVEPDLVLLDLTLPDGDGRDVCRELRRRSDVPIVMLTARGTEMDRIVGLELGADDYVVKPFSAARGDLPDPRRPAAPRPDASGAAPSRSRSASWSSIPARAARPLAGRAAGALAQGVRPAGRAGCATPGQVVTREDLMSRVWDANWFGSTKTLDVHIGWLRRKLGDDPADPRYIETVRGVGFRFVAPEDEVP